MGQELELLFYASLAIVGTVAIVVGIRLIRSDKTTEKIEPLLAPMTIVETKTIAETEKRAKPKPASKEEANLIAIAQKLAENN